MSEAQTGNPELPNIVRLLAEKFEGTPLAHFLMRWENIIFASAVMVAIILAAYFSARKCKMVPGKLQNVAEIVAGGIDDFVCGILGPEGRRYTPFIGTLFIYIISMNLLGLIPFMKSATASLSITLALALCVFVYVEYAALRNFGFFGYFYHLMEKPKGLMAATIIMPLFMFLIHFISEIIRPLTLSLRLRSNMWGDEILLAIMSKFGLQGLPLLFFDTLIALLKCVVQALVFCLLATIYFALATAHEEKKKEEEENMEGVKNGL
ncbi:MAG: F0F1 ATP synthase subunit A [Candidatus Omnitrophica bacterium]|nr:F0F1 ATP synthase subunit A [Candidatus Omnitrophota bacterium]